jgi:hypothetical protein
MSIIFENIGQFLQLDLIEMLIYYHTIFYIIVFHIYYYIV